jgi:hypothetical protein
MSWDGSTSGEPYFWQTPASDYNDYQRTPDHPPFKCWCCEEPYHEDDLHRTVDGWACWTCEAGWWLADTTKRRTMDFGGAWTR